MAISCTYVSMFNYRWLSINAFIFILTCFVNVTGQEIELKQEKATELLSERGEIIIRFRKPESLSLEVINLYLSIDNFDNDTITAYANATGFEWFTRQAIPFKIIDPPSLKMHLKSSGLYVPAYPTYSEYVNLMNSFVRDYPDICTISEFGTSVDGRKLLAIKITDEPAVKENEPVLLYSATMHGDEPLGFVLMLKLIRYLLEDYPTDPLIRELINNTEIWINPLANPDGAYFVSDTSIYGAKRFNRNNIDLNRDFPRISLLNPDTSNLQPETRYMINLMKRINPTLAANFHGGAEVVNYPWDSWAKDHPDRSWYRKISRAYVDTVHAHAPAGYMTFGDDGITRGVDWYQVNGGRQDYVNYYLYGREVTIELSNDKIPPDSEIENYWNYNRRSLIRYIAAAHTGFRGSVTDSSSGEAVIANIRVNDHDRDNSFVFSDEAGYYFRLIDEGIYEVEISAPGYKDKVILVSVPKDGVTRVDAELEKDFDLRIYPNPFRDKIKLIIPFTGNTLKITFIDVSGRKVKIIEYPVTYSGEHEIPVKNLSPGYYIIRISNGNQTRQFKAIRSPE